MTSNQNLFRPLTVGTMQLKHRIAMAPLTRFRAREDHVHIDEAVKYYQQRACVPGTLLITEATFISTRASGYAKVPSIHSAEQVAAWRKVTDAVHAKGSYIYCQLWYLGRAAVPKELAKDGLVVRSASDIPMHPKAPKPREMSIDEIKEAVEDYVHAAKLAMEAGFDGVEIHGANGYLIDQYLQDNSNQRTDQYGGSIENRVRFPLEVIDAVVKGIGAQHVGLRMSPFSSFQGMKMADPRPTFSYYVDQLPRDLAYIHATEARVSGASSNDHNPEETLDFIRERWSGPFITAGGFTRDSAIEVANIDDRTIVAFGRYFISNPDLVAKIKTGQELTKYNRDTFYTHDNVGYTDYAIDDQLVRKAFNEHRL